MKNIEKLSYPDIYELIQLNKYIHNCKRIDLFDDMLQEHKARFDQIMDEFNKDQGRHFTFVTKKPAVIGKAQKGDDEGTQGNGDVNGSPHFGDGKDTAINGSQKGDVMEFENPERSTEKLIDKEKDIVVQNVSNEGIDLGVAYAHKAKARESYQTGMTKNARAQQYVDAVDEPVQVKFDDSREIERFSMQIENNGGGDPNDSPKKKKKFIIAGKTLD